jgi:hypothetical protein
MYIGVIFNKNISHVEDLHNPTVLCLPPPLQTFWISGVMTANRGQLGYVTVSSSYKLQ